MTVPERRTPLHRLTGLLVLVMFGVFAGNIVLAKLSTVIGFSAPRLSVQAEFSLLLLTTFLAVAFLIGEERRSGPTEP